MTYVKTRIVLLVVWGLLSSAAAQTPAVVQGTVVDGKGQAMPFVNVQLVGTTDGAATDQEGQFRFTTTRQGRQTVQATMIGFESASRTVTLAPGETVPIELVLKETLLTLDEAVVTASAYTTGEAETVTLQPLEVVTTPGAAADIFRAIQTFPGVTAIDDGAGLFVRGGDVSETVTILDQATVVHPYKYESPTGVEGAARGKAALQHVRVDHCGAHVFVAEEFLHGAKSKITEGMSAPSSSRWVAKLWRKVWQEAALVRKALMCCSCSSSGCRLPWKTMNRLIQLT